MLGEVWGLVRGAGAGSVVSGTTVAGSWTGVGASAADLCRAISARSRLRCCIVWKAFCPAEIAAAVAMSDNRPATIRPDPIITPERLNNASSLGMLINGASRLGSDPWGAWFSVAIAEGARAVRRNQRWIIREDVRDHPAPALGFADCRGQPVESCSWPATERLVRETVAGPAVKRLVRQPGVSIERELRAPPGRRVTQDHTGGHGSGHRHLKCEQLAGFELPGDRTWRPCKSGNAGGGR